MAPERVMKRTSKLAFLFRNKRWAPTLSGILGTVLQYPWCVHLCIGVQPENNLGNFTGEERNSAAAQKAGGMKNTFCFYAKEEFCTGY